MVWRGRTGLDQSGIETREVFAFAVGMRRRQSDVTALPRSACIDMGRVFPNLV